jgi:CCR4-NOT transcription complex subunit 7/8
MDTEFPGVVARPIGSFKTSSDYHYQTMRCNVDLLKIIQIGVTLADEHGNFPPEVATWQFNFHFSVNDDMYAPESVELLQKSVVDFQRHEEIGIDPNDFAEVLITSGLVLSDDTTWISFHSGYDFGYLVKILSGAPLPPSEDTFFNMLKIWFPRTYDVKSIVRSLDAALKGGLQDVADEMGIMRVGTSHTAGSDSLLTASTFFKTRTLYFADGPLPESDFNGRLFGLGASLPSTNGTQPEPTPLRGGATLAEREDRGSVAHPPGVNGAQPSQQQQQQQQGTFGGIAASALANSMAAPQAYGSMAAAGGALLRGSLGQR